MLWCVWGKEKFSPTHGEHFSSTCHKRRILAQGHNRKGRISSLLKNFYIVDMTKEMVKFIRCFNPVILLNWLLFNPLAHTAVEDPWLKIPSFDWRSVWTYLLNDRFVTCWTQVALDFHTSWFATSLFWTGSRAHGNHQKGFTGRRQMTELVGHSLLSKVRLHLSEYSLLFPLLHILMHVLAQQDFHQMEIKSLFVAVAKCIWH